MTDGEVNVDELMAARPEIPVCAEFDYLVIVPTVGDPDVAIPTLQRMTRHCDGTRTLILVVLNAENAERHAAFVAAAPSVVTPPGTRAEILALPGLAGFSGAVNAGIRRAAGGIGFPRVTVICNDDVAVTAGWLQGLDAALHSMTVRLQGDPQDADRDAVGYGKVGLAGPASDNVSGMQRVEPSKEAMAGGVDAFAYQFRQVNVGNVMSADFLSGFCIALKRDALVDLLIGSGDTLGLFDGETFPIGGYEDNDLCARADRLGWRCVVAGDVFVHHDGHRTFDRLFPGMNRGLANRIAYYRKWAPQTVMGERKICAVYRVRMETAHDLVLWRNSVAKVATLVDTIAVLVTANPLEVCQSQDFQPLRAALTIEDHRLLESCSGASARDVAIAVGSWVGRFAAAGIEATQTKRAPPEIRCVVWEGGQNERDQRNAAIALGEATGADWLLSVDHDEVPEDRLTRTHLERLTRHPDPLVQCWDFGWLNHWDSMRLVRQDAPWADGDGYRTGMRGFRFWRVNRMAPRRILAGTVEGLHCGNCPDFDLMSKRVSGLRFRHFGYLRAADRVRKHARYTTIDPTPDRRLVGGDGYAHLLHEEGMRLSPYVPLDGIGLHVLLHAGESAIDVGRWFDTLYGIVDCAVLVWTGEWDAADRPPIFPAGPEVDDAPPATGPGRDVWELSGLFGACWTHRELDDNMARARNVGIGSLAESFADRLGLGWALFIDPDEWFDDTFADCVALRRMAEASDSYGWMFRVQNYHRNEHPTRSESVRMSRLVSDMRMSGRVHEGFTHAVAALHAQGIHPQFRYAPFVLHHRGLALAPDALKIKIDRYARLLVGELVEDPRNADAWVALGCHYIANDRLDLAEAAFTAGMSANPLAYGPAKELAMLHLRIARGLMGHVVDHTAQSVAYRRVAQTMLDWLREWAPNPPTLGVVPDPNRVPEFPVAAANALAVVRSE